MTTDQSKSELPGTVPAATAPERRHRRRNLARLVVSLVLVALLVAFVLGNSQTVSVSFVFTTTSVPLIWVLLVTAVLGAVADRLVIVVQDRRRARRARAQAGEAPGAPVAEARGRRRG